MPDAIQKVWGRIFSEWFPAEQMLRLNNILQDEDKDVKKLESLSITGLFYSILGSKQQQLE